MLGAKVDERQEAAQAAGGGQVELLPPGARAEDQRDAVLVGEGAGGPVVLDEEEAAVAWLFVEQDRVVERQNIRNFFQTADVERQQRVIPLPPSRTSWVVNSIGSGPSARRDGDVLEVVVLEEADPLVEVVRRDLAIGSGQPEGRVEIGESDLEAAGDACRGRSAGRDSSRRGCGRDPRPPQRRSSMRRRQHLSASESRLRLP